VQAWLLDFKNIYTKAKAIELPDTQQDRATDAFIVVVEPLASPLVAVWEAHYINKELQEYPSIYSTIKQFRNYLREKQEKEQVAQQGAFVSFKGTPQHKNDAHTKANDNKGPKPCLYGKQERFRDCPYLCKWNQPTN
jgi:hypothetical protein